MAPNWDSWGKIRILGGTFDAELVSRGWEEDIKLPPGSKAPTMEDDQPSSPNGGNSARGPSAIAQYEYWCRDPNSGGLAVVESAMSDGSAVGVMSDDPQEFLERQLKILEAFKAKAPETTSEGTLSSSTRRLNFGDEKSVKDHIGPVQFNMGGIQVDADDMLQRLKVRPPLFLWGKCYNMLTMDDRTATHTLLRQSPMSLTRMAPQRTWPRTSTTSSCRTSSVDL